jgi:hypothetical protein
MLDPITYIKEQLAQREISIELHQFKKVVTHLGVSRYEVPAYNELLFLTNAAQLPVGTRIVSDTNIIQIGPEHAQSEALEEFSGLVAITIPAHVASYPVIEFIQILI